MRKIIYLFVFIISPALIFAQAERYNWVFGDSCGVTFNTVDTVPQIISGSISRALEGCACISDSLGNLLFSTDGISVYNKQFNEINPNNSMFGQFSSTQSAIIVKIDSKPGLFYIFYVGGMAGSSTTRGLYYSILDLKQNGGQGSIIEYNHNVNDFSVEKITAIPNASNSGIWIIVNNDLTGYYFSYLFENEMIVDSVKSPAVHIGNTSLGYMKPNRLGTMIVSSEYREAADVLYDFDRFTGRLTPKFDIDYSKESGYSGGYIYGNEFSNSGRFLYCSFHTIGINHSSIVQFDLSLNNAKDIWLNKYVLADGNVLNNSPYYFGALLMAPDSNIYIAKFNQKNLGRINSPDQPGLACDYDPNAFIINGTCRWGLPNFYDFPCKIMKLQMPDTVRTCFRKSVSIGINPENNFVYKWVPAYGLSKPNSSMTNAIVDTNTIYTLYATDTLHGCLYFSSVIIITSMTDAIHISGKDLICEGDSIELSIPDGFGNILWSNGMNTQSIFVKDSGTYQVTCEDTNFCVYTAEKTVRLNKDNPINIFGDTIICENTLSELSISNAYYNPVWSTGEEAFKILINSGGEYSVSADDKFGCKHTGSISVISAASDKFANFDFNAGSICLNRKSTNEIDLSGIAQFDILIDSVYAKYDSSTIFILVNYNEIVGKFYKNDVKKLIFDIIPYSPGILYDTIFLRIIEPCPKLLKIPITAFAGKSELKISGKDYFCHNDSTYIYVDSSFLNIKWSNGKTAPGIYITKGGSYTIECNDVNGCSLIGGMTIREIIPEEIVIDGQDSICTESKTKLTSSGDFAAYNWSDGEHTPSIEVDTPGLYSLDAIDSLGCTHHGQFKVSYFETKNIDISGKPLFCALDGQMLKAGDGYVNYIWSTGETGQSININQPGTYTVTANDSNGCLRIGEFTAEVYGFLTLKPQSVDLGSLCQSESIDFNIKMVNTLNIPITIIASGILVGNEISDSDESKVVTLQNDQVIYSHKFNFHAAKLGAANDTVYIHFISPCDYYYKIPVTAFVTPSIITISSADSTFYLAGEACLPIFGQFDCTEQDSSIVDYTAEISFDTKLFTPEFVKSGTLLSISGEGGGYLVRFSDQNTVLSQNRRIINYICGSVNAGVESSDLAIPTYFNEGGEVSAKFEPGAIRLQICSNELRGIDLFTPTTLTATPNPAVDNISVSVATGETGAFTLEMISSDGALIKSINFSLNEKDASTYKIKIPLTDIVDGLYFLRLRSPGNIINVKVIVKK